MPKIIIALDGYSSCGKSTTAKLVAAQLGFGYIDTGAMYRAVCLFFLQNHLSPTNPNDVQEALQKIQIDFRYNAQHQRNETYLNGLNVEDEIRKMYVANGVSEVSVIPQIRRAMVAHQQKMGKNKGIVMDGRDIGTMVFPKAELKLFMTAEPTIRAVRRQQELLEKGDMVDLDIILQNIQKRDLIDTTRSEGPLRQADDAIGLDTSFMTIDEQVEFVVNLADGKIGQRSRIK